MKNNVVKQHHCSQLSEQGWLKTRQYFIY